MRRSQALLGLGQLALARGDRDEARRWLQDVAGTQTDGSGSPHTALAVACLPELEERWPGALPFFNDHPDHFPVQNSMTIHAALWQRTRDPLQLEAAHQLLMRLRDGSPLACQSSMLSRVRLHDEIHRAHQEP
jgi:hypothetical protein